MKYLSAAALGWMLCCFSATCSGDEPDVRYSTQGVLPKAETGALRFLEEHPEYDGRGVVVAIFDTGIDPGAAGLQMTSDGRPKVVDLIDASGSGDVLTTTVHTAENQQIEGASGRTLKLDPDWTCPTGEFHVGWKRGFELFPDDLVPRLKRERRRTWDAEQRVRETELREQLAALKPADKEERKELQARIDVLAAAEKGYDDPGPIYDCVVFHDGEKWRAAIDTDEDGEFADEVLLTNYRDERQFTSFGGESALNFSVNIYEDGDRLSIVTMAGSHGTHVAGIVSANFPDAPERNGIAPGAQIVSVKIGDTRLDGMETGTGLFRGIKAVLDDHCDLINMSYGEPTSTPNRGRLAELFSELVTEHGVIFVSSAGNDGPALSTVGAPGGTTSAILGVGAYVSPAMMRAEYALRAEEPGLPYTWTSRGPTADGDFGVDLFAPGGAISPVPTYTRQPSEQMNGTSMASPNACGNIALLISGAKAGGISYSPASVRHALQNTAERIDDDLFAEGAGLIQIDRAFDHLQQWADAPGEELFYDIRIPDRNNARGIYLRETDETTKPADFRVFVRPVYAHSATPAERLKLEVPIVLESTADWVTTGRQLLLTSGGDRFEVQVDPEKLDPGAHSAEVKGYDANQPERGPLFRVPITVLKPDAAMEHALKGTTHLKAGQIIRHFLPVPRGATWADVSLKLKADTQRTIVFHAVQLIGGQSYEDGQYQRFLLISPGHEGAFSFAVEPGHTLEVCLAQYWSSLGDSDLDYEVSFRGLTPSSTGIGLPSDGAAFPVDVTSELRRERCAPQARLSTVRKLLRPRSSTISPLTAARDEIPEDRREWQLLLEYDVKLTKKANVTISCPDLEELLYDAPVDSFRWMVYDANKQYMGAGDMFPESSVSLEKGDYTLRVDVRHTDRDALEKRKSMLMAVDRDLPSAIDVGVYASRTDALSGGSPFDDRTLDVGETASLWLRESDKLRDGVEAGDVLIGQITFVGSRDGEPGAHSRPGGFPLELAVPPEASEKPESKTAEKPGKPELTTAERIDRDLLEAKLGALKSLKWPDDKEEFDKLASEILQEHPDERRVYVIRLHVLDTDERKERLPLVIEAADKVIDSIDQAALMQRLSGRVDPDDAEAVADRKKAEAEREMLIDALYRKGRALAYMELPDVIAEHPIADQAAHDELFEQNFRTLARWVDTTEKQYFLLDIRRDRRKERYGQAIELLNKYIDEQPPTYLYYKKRRDMYGEMGWSEWQDYERRWLLIRFPKAYQPF